MKIVLISAMQEEIAPITNKIKNIKVLTKKGMKFIFGKYNNHDLICTSSGIGKVNASLTIAIIDSLFENIDLIINIGISGGVYNNIDKGEVVIGTKYSYADADATIFGYEFGQIPRMPRFYYSTHPFLDTINNVKKGLILTSDKFMTDINVVNDLKQYFEDDILCLDMESTAYAQACYVQDIPFVSIRLISDLIGEENQKEKYIDYEKIACEKAIDILIKILS